MKKFLSLVLVLTMVLALAVPAFAADTEPEKGSITINDAEPKETYTLYQILSLESYNKTSGAYSYKANSEWETWLRSNATDYVEFDTQGYVTWKAATDYATVAAFAKAALAYAKQENSGIHAIDTKTADSTTVSFTDLELGYYLVGTSLGTLCSLNTTNPNVTMEEKNTAPTSKKEVKEGTEWVSENDANIGDTVEFRATINLPKNSKNVVFHDKMDAGLTLNEDSIKVYSDADLSNEITTGFETKIIKDDKDTFTVTFTEEYLNGLTADSTTVYIAYSAVINENAFVAGVGNTNTGKLTYGDNNNSKDTPADKTTTKTWKFDVTKYTKNGEKEELLAGATFKLSKDVDGVDTVIPLVATGVANTYRVAKKGETGTVTEITTTETGKLYIEGLDSGTYSLTETKAPDGYNKLPGAVTVVIDKDGKVNETNNTEVKVENKSGTQLPSTGGIGTTIFYVVGIVLMAGAAILLITKKRMSAE